MALEKKAPKHLKGLYKFYIGCILMFVVLAYSKVNHIISNNYNVKDVNSAINRNLIKNSLIDHSSHHVRTLLQEEEEQEQECRFVHQVEGVDQKCQFVQNTSSCDAGGPIDYNYFVFCDLGEAVWGAMIILILWWLFCFNGLAVTADEFFCPSLVVIAKTLRLSPNVAGVTFLAFGNGAPDLFSAIAALSETDEGDAGLGVGGLLGAGMFVTSVVTGTIAIIKPFKAMERPFLRDITFYMFGVFWTFTTLWRGKIYLWEAIGFITAYFFYVVVVVVSGSIYKRQKEKEKNNKLGGEDFLSLTSEGRFKKIGDAYSLPSFDVLSDNKMKKSTTQLSIYENLGYTNSNGKPPLERQDSMEDFMNNKVQRSPSKEVSFELGTIEERFEEQQKEQTENGHVLTRNISQDTVQSSTSSDGNLYDDIGGSDDYGDDEELGSPIKQFLDGINPINVEEWPEMGFIGKFYEIFKCPLIFGLNLTCPVVNYDVPKTHNWNKYLQCFQCLFTPMIISFMIGFGFGTLGDSSFPVWALMWLIGVPISLLVFCTSKEEEKPKYHWAFGYAGFFISMIWIYTIANAIVNLLQTFGIVLNISDAILGLTLLAWGNSIGDWIADTVMARQGFARMGFAACFGAPFFNLMLGFGIPMIVTMGKTGGSELALFITPVQLILTGFLLTNLCINIVFLNLSGFKVTRVYGIITIIFYLVFLVTAILTESGVLLSDWVQKRECVVDCP